MKINDYFQNKAGEARSGATLNVESRQIPLEQNETNVVQTMVSNSSVILSDLFNFPFDLNLRKCMNFVYNKKFS